MGYLALMRPLVCLSAAGAAFAGLAALGFPLERPAPAVLTMLAVFLLMGAADAFNDYFDRDIDAVNMPGRPIPSGRVSPRGALLWALFLFAAGNLAAWGVNARTAAAAAGISLLYAAYGVWSKKLGFVKNLMIAVTGSSSVLIAGPALGRTNAVYWAAGGVGFLMMLAVELLKDVEDMAGDAACGARTWALAVGPKRAGSAARLCVAAAAALGAVAGGAGLSRGVFWPLFLSGAALSAAPFLGLTKARGALLVLGGAALSVAALVAGSL